MDIEKIRNDFNITKTGRIYLDNGAVAPIPQPVVDAARDFYDRQSRGGFDAYAWVFNEVSVEARSQCAQLIHASPEEIAFIDSTATGISIMANMLDWRPGDNVVITDLEFFPYQWVRLKKFGVSVRVVPSKKPDGTRDVTIDDLRPHVDKNTRVICLSQVSWTNGLKHDLKAVGQLARQFGAYLALDAIQSIGAMEFDVNEGPVDFLSCGGYKWLLGTPGIGFFYCRGELISRFEPERIGWHSNRVRFLPHFHKDYELTPTAERFTPGGYNMAGVCALKASTRYLLDLGLDQIGSRNRMLAEHFVSGLRTLGIPLLSPQRPEARSQIITFIPSDLEKALRLLPEKGFPLPRKEEGIRVSPNFYNETWEIDRLLETLEFLEKGK